MPTLKPGAPLESSEEPEGLEPTHPAAQRAAAPLLCVAVTPEYPGRYEFRRLLAQGGQSQVWVAFDTHLGREVAFKQPVPSQGGPGIQGASVHRFLREAQITAQLEHPNIVPTYEIGQREDGSYYCTQKLILPTDGDDRPLTLRRALDGARSLEERLALLPSLLAVCNALAFAHRRGVIHRDLKPENVVIGAFGDTVVLDWGLAAARHRPSPSTGADLSTLGGVAFGTPSYMSPEQALGRLEEIDERTDVWALGALLYEILTGAPPFHGATGADTIRMVITEPLSPPRQRCPEAPPALAAVAERALQRLRAERYPNAGAFAAELSAYLSGARVAVYDYSPLELAKLFVARHRAITTVIALALALLAVAAGLVWRSYLTAERYLGEARKNLAIALVEKARDAERKLQWDRAAAYYSAARVQDDRADARWGSTLAQSRATFEPDLLRGHAGAVTAITFSPDGRRLASAGGDRRIRVWDFPRRRELQRLEGHEDLVVGLAFSPDGERLVSASEDRTLRLWDLAAKAPPSVLHEHREPLNAVAFSADGRTVVAAAEDGLVLLFDAAAGRELARLEGHEGPAYAVAFASDAVTFASAGYDNLIRVWQLSAESPRWTVDVHPGGRPGVASVLGLSFSPDGKVLASAGRDAEVRLWSTDDGRPLNRLDGHTRKIYAVSFSPDGRLLATGGTDKTVRLWDAATGQAQVGASYGFEEDVRALAFSPDGRWLAWGGSGDAVWVRPVPANIELERDPANRIYALAFAPSGRTFLVGGLHTVSFHDPVTLERQDERRELGNFVVDASFSPDGQFLVATCGKQGVCVFDGRTQRARFDGHSDFVHTVAISPDGTRAVSAGNDAEVHVWELRSGRPLGRLRGHRAGIFSTAFSPDGATLATGSYDKTVRLWDVARGVERARLEGHTHGVRRVAFSPDGRVLASAGWDKTIRLWDASTGAELRRLEGHDDHVFGLAWDPRGAYLASGGWDGTLRLGDSTTGQPLAQFVGDEPRIHSVAIAPDGSSILYAGLSVHRLGLAPLGEPQEELKRTLEQTGLMLEGLELSRRPR